MALLLRKKKRDKAEPYYDERYTRYYVEYPLQFTGEQPNTQPPVNPISNRVTTEIHLINIREGGSYITARTMQHTSSIIHHNLAFPEFDYHSLRHTHATMLSEKGAPMQYIQKRLGHKKEKITAEVYTNHLTEAMKTQGDNILNGIFLYHEPVRRHLSAPPYPNLTAQWRRICIFYPIFSVLSKKEIKKSPSDQLQGRLKIIDFTTFFA